MYKYFNMWYNNIVRKIRGKNNYEICMLYLWKRT